MKSILFGMLALVALAITNGKYTDKYDNTDVNEILSNRRLLVSYIHCVLDKGPCTPDGKELKSHIKEGLETDCAKCTDVQKNQQDNIFRHLINKESAYWDELKQKFDPTSKYTAEYERKLKE